jgi:hypothetical protein
MWMCDRNTCNVLLSCYLQCGLEQGLYGKWAVGCHTRLIDRYGCRTSSCRMFQLCQQSSKCSCIIASALHAAAEDTITFVTLLCAAPVVCCACSGSEARRL